MSLKNCAYCGKEITTRSREHIIQNALGGLYESTDICCPECNNYVSKYIDAPFTKIFNPIIGGIDNFAKTNNKKSVVPCSGTVLYNNKKYPAIIKDGRVASCAQLSQELKSDISKLPLTIISYDFNLSNTAFKNGIAKIAFNYALDYGINLSILQHGLSVQKSGNQIQSINFSYPLIPFVPTNPIDGHIELNTPFEPYHNMILFSQHNTLWCYIDLFNTFQYYVLLSDKYDSNVDVYNNYTQSLQKLDRQVPRLYISSPQDVLYYANQYNVSPTMDIDEFRKRIQIAINRKSQKKNISDVISEKMRNFSIISALKNSTDLNQTLMYHTAIQLYFDENDNPRTENFRTLTPTANGIDITSYPFMINELIKNKIIDARLYTFSKYNKLNQYLCQCKR